jgi:hypothetical protein
MGRSPHKSAVNDPFTMINFYDAAGYELIRDHENVSPARHHDVQKAVREARGQRHA